MGKIMGKIIEAKFKSNTQITEGLQDLLDMAENGDLKSVAVVYIETDGTIDAFCDAKTPCISLSGMLSFLNTKLMKVIDDE